MIILKQYLKDFSESEYDFAFSLMTEERQKAVLRKRYEKDRKATILGEHLARNGIAQLLNIDGNKIVFERTPDGKPIAKNLKVDFSISHSKDLVVCSVDEDKIGIDCEFIRNIDLRVTKIACADSDKEFIFGTDDIQEQRINFFKIWTAKEAYFKYLGTGITNLKSVEYKDIQKNCQTENKNGYIITVYRE